MAVTFPVLKHRFRQEQPRDIHDSGLASIGRVFLPSVRSSANEHVVRNLSLLLGELFNATAKATAAPKQSLDSLAKVVLDNYIDLDYLPDEQGGIYAIVNITCCIDKCLWRSRNSITQDKGTSTLVVTNFTWLSTVLQFVQLATFKSRILV